jgi:hypothetical protein
LIERSSKQSARADFQRARAAAASPRSSAHRTAS